VRTVRKVDALVAGSYQQKTELNLPRSMARISVDVGSGGGARNDRRS